MKNMIFREPPAITREISQHTVALEQILYHVERLEKIILEIEEREKQMEKCNEY